MTDKSRLGWFLKDRNIKNYIIGCAQRALGGQTPEPLRQYSFSFDEFKKLVTFKAEVERDLTEDEREDLAVAETEIYADFGDDTLVDTIISVVPMNLELQALSGGIVYIRSR